MTLRNDTTATKNCETGAAAAEFTLLLPLALLFLFGIIDVGRLMWTLNSAEKAVQMGSRAAIVSTFIPGGLSVINYATTLGQGSPISSASFGAVRCSKPARTVTCSCVKAPCPTLTPIDPRNFDAIVARMRGVAPAILAQDVEIIYSNSGLGYAGDPNGADIAPLVTVRAVGIDFTPLLFQFFGASFALPTVSASLTMEDGAGPVSEAN